MSRWFCGFLSLVVLAGAIGCGASTDELGPVQEAEEVDPQEVQKQIQQSMKYLPKRARPPKQVFPSGGETPTGQQ